MEELSLCVKHICSLSRYASAETLVFFGPDPEWQVIEQQGTFSGPGGGPVRLVEHRGKQLNPVGDELAVGRLTHFPGLRIKAEAPGPIAGHPRGLHVGVACADGHECFGDPAGDELVVARGFRTLTALEVALTLIAVSVPCLLTRQKLGEDVRFALIRRALVALAAVARLTVGSVELYPRVRVLGLWALHPRFGDLWHGPRVAP